ncbi:MAG: sugar phosphate nucleotidyltransferase [Gemmatimonadetes bacterium]|nr:sugar phosphate nucleotidyltransferase [Gemmatimonadota bacterium]
MSQLERPFAVVLAGGVGSRFWPASRPERPKQLLPLGTDRPLIVDAVERAVALAGPERVLIVLGTHLVDPVLKALPNLEPANLLVEPEARGTGPALAWAAHVIAERDPEGVMVSLHADHVIEPLDEFLDTISRGVAATGGGRLLCLGIEPDRPETGYGYVRLGAELAPGVFAAAEFVEKPPLETARAYVDSGEYLWNSGIFIWRAADLLAAIRTLAPEIPLERLENGEASGFFEACARVTIDVAVMERASRVGVVAASFGWDDVGDWNALRRTWPTDRDGNIVFGSVDLVDSGDNIVWSEDGSITLFGVHDLVVVRSGDHTFVTTREAAADMKRIFEATDSPEEA